MLTKILNFFKKKKEEPKHYVIRLGNLIVMNPITFSDMAKRENLSEEELKFKLEVCKGFNVQLDPLCPKKR